MLPPTGGTRELQLLVAEAENGSSISSNQPLRASTKIPFLIGAGRFRLCPGGSDTELAEKDCHYALQI